MTSLFADVEPLIRQQLTADNVDGSETIHTRDRERGGLFRVSTPTGESVVVKTWRVRNLKEKLRALTGTSNARREWRMHRLLFRSGIEVAVPLAYHTLVADDRRGYEIIIMEDLKETKRALSILKELLARGDEARIAEFEDRLIYETFRLVQLHVLDIDHQLNNLVVDERERLVRVDLECARRYPARIMPRAQHAKMLARFITGHIHAVQPDTDRSVRFAQRLYATLGTDARLRRLVQGYVDGNLARQLVNSGIETRITLPA